MTPTSEVILYRCRKCGFRFYNPSYAGRAEFYKELDGSAYYVTERPEFHFALHHLARHSIVKPIVDVGSGSGAFLDLAARKPYDVRGVEFNPDAVAKARARGHIVYEKALQALRAEDLRDGVDAVTMFHVLEHVPNPVQFVRDATDLLSPGGVLIVTVPNGGGLFRIFPYDPMNLPPHHISYWRRSDLRRVTALSNLRCDVLTADPLYGGVLKEFWLQHVRLKAVLGRSTLALTPKIATVGSWIYRKSGMRYMLPKWGLSMYGVFVKN